jgi:thiamine biosynthesis lipoprotein
MTVNKIFTRKSFILLFLLIGSFISNSQTVRKRTTLLMGGRFDITIVAKDSLSAEKNIDIVIGEIKRIENLIY